MIEFEGTFFPDGETHLIEWLQKKGMPRVDGQLVYQHHKYLAAKPYIPTFQHAIDVGANLGLWTRFLSKDFNHVTAFEPVAAYRECWLKNVASREFLHLVPVALGAGSGTVSMWNFTEGSCGDTRVVDAGDGDGGTVPMTTLDSYHRNGVGLIKIDCEGFERYVLEGAVETLERCRPCVIVEQKPGKAAEYDMGQTDAVAFLKDLGGVLRKKIAGDYIVSFD